MPSLKALAMAASPGAKYQCACVHHDAVACATARYGYSFERAEPCQCICHDQDEDDSTPDYGYTTALSK